MTAPKQPTYTQRITSELAAIRSSYIDILAASGIKDLRTNNRSGMVFIGFPNWGWKPSGSELEAARMELLRRVRNWGPRFRLLFPHPTREVNKRLDDSIGLLEAWLTRDAREHDIPPTIEQAQDNVSAAVADLRGLVDLLPSDDFPVRLVVDTNALIDNPDVSAYTHALGKKYVAHLLPVVLRELDDLKRTGRNEELRQAARRAERRLKGIRSNGDARQGVRVEGEVVAKFEHIEPRSESLPEWLDMTVPDDRFVASTLLLQSDHPGSALHVATSDINMQTKLSAVGLPYVEPPDEEHSN